jgi:hypothetical protein
MIKKPINAIELNTNAIEDFKEQGQKLNTSRFDHELYKEEDHIVLPMIRIKHIALPHQGSRWKVFEDNKIVCIIEGKNLNKKEREFLKTVSGANWLLGQAKAGIASFTALRAQLKKQLSLA